MTLSRTSIYLSAALAVGFVSSCGGRAEEAPIAESASALVLAPGCLEIQTPLQAEGGSKPGYALISNDSTDAEILFVAQGSWEPGSWLIESLSLQLGGAPSSDPTTYAVQQSLGGVDATRVRLPLPAACGSHFQLAAQLTLVRGSERVTVWAGGTPWGPTPEPGWAYGTPFASGAFGWTVDYRVCCDTIACTRGMGYWKNHINWPVASLSLGQTSYAEAQLRQLLKTPVGGDASLILAHALITARLNVATGVVPSPQARAALADAAAWVDANRDADGRLPYGVRPNVTAGKQAVRIAALLQTLNEGRGGAPACTE